MFMLLETLIAFAAIMLLLSYLVKALTSVIKNHVQYFSENFELEVRRLVESLSGKAIAGLENVQDKNGKYPFRGIDWRHVGTEYLTEENVKALVKDIAGVDLTLLKQRLEQHKASLVYAFEKRMKNLSLACGLGVCLLFNVNAVSIWQELYENGEVRAKFASEEFVDKAIEKFDRADEVVAPVEEAVAETSEEKERIGAEIATIEKELKGDLDESRKAELGQQLEAKRQELEAVDGEHAKREAALEELSELREQRDHYQKELDLFLAEIDFGVGNVWKDKRANLLFEFFGSLITAILISVGAPYWHDLLRTLTALRKRREVAAGA